MHTPKIVHLTSAHPRFDTRIFYKMCMSLAKQNYSVSLVVADGKGNEKKNYIDIIDVGASKGRLKRIFKTTKQVYVKAIELDADIYHLHDPELIPMGVKLKKKGKRVIFDAHEDLPKQILGKPYLKPFTRKILSFCILHYEKLACNKLSAIIAATPYIRDKFLKINPTTIDVNNYPMLGELITPNVNWTDKSNSVCYVGGISEIRGIHELVKAMELLTSNASLKLGGSFNSSSFETQVKKEKGWNKVEELGWLNREQVASVYADSIAGLVTLYPVINYLDSLPVKMFEYMSAGIPVIASNFPLWKEIIEGNSCGICVDPLTPIEIASAIEHLIKHPDEAKKMGVNGQKAVTEKYNWAQEELKLLTLYKTLLNH